MSELAPHLARGQKTRENLMSHAVAIATCEGLEALTIGRVAEIAGIAKASVLGHYGSKEQLQLATLEAGSQQFIASVVTPAGAQPEGILRLDALTQGWMERITSTPGGCLFASVSAEFDGRAGVVRDRIQKLVQMWLAVLTREAARAKELKQLTPSADPEQLVFSLHGIQLSLNLRVQLLEDDTASERAREALDQLLLTAASPLGKKLLSARRNMR